MPVVNDYRALLSGSYWNGIEITGQPIIVTYSFPTTAPDYDASIQGFTADTVNSFTEFTPAEQAQAVVALSQWSAASGIVFIQVAPGQGDINFQNVNLSTAGYGAAGGIGFYPFGDTNLVYPYFWSDLNASGDVFMNTAFQSGDGTVALGTLVHEIGHAIGLKHPTEVVGVHDQVLEADNPNQTIMAQTGVAANPDTLKTLDQQAAAFLYGASGGAVVTSSASGSNSVSNWEWDDATQTLIQTAAGVGVTIHGTSVNDEITGSTGDDRLFGLAGDNNLYGLGGADTLYDGPGNNHLEGGDGDDTYYVSNSATVIVETPTGGALDSVYATASYALPDNIEFLQVFGDGLTARGNNQGDTLYGDWTHATTIVGGTGGDYILGGSAADTITGGGGGDLMFGGDGADRYIFNDASESPAGSPQTIGDFTSGQDKIDLSAILTTGGNPGQPLTYIGQNGFHNVAGEVHEVIDIGATLTTLEGDLDGNGIADFAIVLYNNPDVQAGDLILTPACFCAGTRIATENGEVAVEDLRIGDRVVTADGAAAPVLWLGLSPVSLRFADPMRSWPIRVVAGALAENVPSRDLLLSPDHALLIDDVLIHAGALVNGTSIVRERPACDAFMYYHVELQRHSILLAENAPAESFVDNVDRMNFVNWAEHEALYPGSRPIDEMPYPRAKSWRQVPPRIRAALDRRAHAIGAVATAAA